MLALQLLWERVQIRWGNDGDCDGTGTGDDEEDEDSPKTITVIDCNLGSVALSESE